MGRHNRPYVVLPARPEDTRGYEGQIVLIQPLVDAVRAAYLASRMHEQPIGRVMEQLAILLSRKKELPLRTPLDIEATLAYLEETDVIILPPDEITKQAAMAG